MLSDINKNEMKLINSTNKLLHKKIQKLNIWNIKFTDIKMIIVRSIISQRMSIAMNIIVIMIIKEKILDFPKTTIQKQTSHIQESIS